MILNDIEARIGRTSAGFRLRARSSFFGTMVDAREQNVYLAKLAEQAERYDEMAEHMKVRGQCSARLIVVSLYQR